MVERRRRIVTRALPLILIAAAAFAGGLIAAGGPDLGAAQRFLDAWARADFAAMHAELTPAAQEEYPVERFERAYVDAAETATVAVVQPGEVEQDGDAAATAPLRIETRVFGDFDDGFTVPLADGSVAWAPHLVFPGLAEGELLSRRTRAPQRAPILAADREPLSSGAASARSVDSAAAAVVGSVGTPSPAQEKALAMRGFPPGTLTGTSGLELAWDERLAGRPGGQLLAVSADEAAEVGGGRVLAATEPLPGAPVRTTIDPALQEAAVSALGSLYGGVAVLDARKGSVLALSGLAYSAPQPPGSTFKVITATGALDAGIVSVDDEFPVETSNSEIGREIPNAHDEACGGTFAVSFALSCNTVFAPLGAELGGPQLVEVAERFGFNATPPLFDPAATEVIDPPASTIPAELSESVETGESAIGQGQVLATPLQMASVAQTIANGGVRMPTPIARTPELRPVEEPFEATSEGTAATMRELMIRVVTEGTGVAAALPGIQVAGKTGTAELGPKALEPGQELEPGEEPPQETDAWFTAFAPAAEPKLAVAVMVVNSDGDGGTVAAPIARDVLAAGLGVG